VGGRSSSRSKNSSGVGQEGEVSRAAAQALGRSLRADGIQEALDAGEVAAEEQGDRLLRELPDAGLFLQAPDGFLRELPDAHGEGGGHPQVIVEADVGLVAVGGRGDAPGEPAQQRHQGGQGLSGRLPDGGVQGLQRRLEARPEAGIVRGDGGDRLREDRLPGLRLGGPARNGGCPEAPARRVRRRPSPGELQGRQEGSQRLPGGIPGLFLLSRGSFPGGQAVGRDQRPGVPIIRGAVVIPDRRHQAPSVFRGKEFQAGSQPLGGPIGPLLLVGLPFPAPVGALAELPDVVEESDQSLKRAIGLHCGSASMRPNPMLVSLPMWRSSPRASGRAKGWKPCGLS